MMPSLQALVIYRAGVDACTEHCEGDGHWHGVESDPEPKGSGA